MQGKSISIRVSAIKYLTVVVTNLAVKSGHLQNINIYTLKSNFIEMARV
jgi:hypothetical protein